MTSPEAIAQYQRHESVESIPPKIDELQPNTDRRKITKITDFQREREVRSHSRFQNLASFRREN